MGLRSWPRIFLIAVAPRGNDASKRAEVAYVERGGCPQRVWSVWANAQKDMLTGRCLPDLALARQRPADFGASCGCCTVI